MVELFGSLCERERECSATGAFGPFGTDCDDMARMAADSILEVCTDVGVHEEGWAECREAIENQSCDEFAQNFLPSGACLTALEDFLFFDDRCTDPGGPPADDTHPPGGRREPQPPDPVDRTVGALSVHPSWDHAGHVEDLRLWLFEGAYLCPPDDGPVPDGAVRRESRPEISGQPLLLASLPVGVRYSVVLRGRLVLDGLSAPTIRGCVEGLLVPGGGRFQVAVPLHVQPLEVAGAYEVRSRVDLADAASAILAAPFSDLQTLLDGADARVSDAMWAGIAQIARAQEGVPPEGAGREQTARWIGAELGAEVVAALAHWRRTTAPNWLFDVAVLARQTIDIVATLHVESYVEISQVTSNDQWVWQGSWTRVTAVVPLSCGPEAPSDCGRVQLAISEVGAGPLPVGLAPVGGTGRMADLRTFRFDRHDAGLPLGPLLRGVLGEHVLPRHSGAEGGVVGLLHAGFRCDLLAKALTRNDDIWSRCLPDELGEACIEASAELLQGWCDAEILEKLGAEAERLLIDFGEESRLSLSGQALLETADGDLQVDRLTGGIWTGAALGDFDANLVSGTFRACRIPPSDASQDDLDDAERCLSADLPSPGR